jgi:hypothetical protein
VSLCTFLHNLLNVKWDYKKNALFFIRPLDLARETYSGNCFRHQKRGQFVVLSSVNLTLRAASETDVPSAGLRAWFLGSAIELKISPQPLGRTSAKRGATTPFHVASHHSHGPSSWKSRDMSHWLAGGTRSGNRTSPSSGEGRNTPTLLGPLKRPNLNHWTTSIMDKVQTPSNSKCWAPSSERFGFHNLRPVCAHFRSSHDKGGVACSHRLAEMCLWGSAGLAALPRGHRKASTVAGSKSNSESVWLNRAQLFNIIITEGCQMLGPNNAEMQSGATSRGHPLLLRGAIGFLVSTTAACRRSQCQLLRLEAPTLRPYSRISRLEPLLFLPSTHEAQWTPFQTQYFSKNEVAMGIEL